MYGYYEYDETKPEKIMELKKIVEVQGELYLSVKNNFRTLEYTLFHKLNEFYNTPNEPRISSYIYDEKLQKMYIHTIDSNIKYTDWFKKLTHKKMKYHYPEYFL